MSMRLRKEMRSLHVNKFAHAARDEIRRIRRSIRDL